MEHAIWNGDRLFAFEIGKDYYKEKMIRRASRQGELLCPDPECKNPIMKYCHGEIREPYFAHRDNAECDYFQFEKNSGVFHGLRLKLYEHFQACDYPVQMEVKVLSHHYSHLFFQWEDGSQTALELGTKSTNLKEVEQLCAEYEKNNMSVCWLVVDQPGKKIREEHTYFLKRFCLNESANRSLLVLGYDGETITQYKQDTNSYTIDSKNLLFKPNIDLFSYKAHISDLYFENGTLTTRGFEEAYKIFLEEKLRTFEMYQKRKEQEREEQQRRYEELERQYEELQRKRATEKSAAEKRSLFDEKYEGERYEKLKRSVLPYIDQQERRVVDEEGNRWIRCEFCGEVKREGEFVSYGGRNKINLGRCKVCKDR